jgi:Transcriptional regulator, AbiEi antitoxin
MAEPSRITDHRGHLSAVERSAMLASRQFWAISRRQLIARGVSEARIRSWLRSGRLDRLVPGVYAWGRADLSEAGQLAAGLLYAGPGSALTGVTALWWLELLGRRPQVADVAAPGRASSRPGLRITHTTNVERSDVRGLPVAALAPALLVAAAELGQDTMRLVLARAEFHRLLDLTELEEGLGRGRAGSARIRAAMDPPPPPACVVCEQPGAGVRPHLRAVRPAVAGAEHPDRSLPARHALA